jgi:hypothetical protein
MGGSGADDNVAADRDAMLIAIGNAMQAYASLEFWLFNLVDILLKARRESAAALFYSIRNNRDKNAGVTALVRSVTGDQYLTFWNSMMNKHIRPTDEIRNKLAHGLVILDGEHEVPRHLVTKPVAYWIDEEGPEEPQYLTRDDVIRFSEKTAALVELVKHFGQHLRGNRPAAFTAKWGPVFAAAVEYPFPVGHPLREGIP